MNKKSDGLSNNTKRENALKRIENLEQAFQQLVSALKGSFEKVQSDSNEMSSAVTNLDRVLTATISVIGGKLNCNKDELLELVKEEVKVNRIAKIEAESQQSDANLKVALAEGKLIAADTIKNDDDIIVSTQVNEKGEVLHPIRAFLALSQFNPGVKELLAGKKVGEEVTIPTGGSVKVLEVYNIVKQEDTPKAK